MANIEPQLIRVNLLTVRFTLDFQVRFIRKLEFSVFNCFKEGEYLCCVIYSLHDG